MKATSTYSSKATSRSLRNNLTTKKGVCEHQDLSFVAVLFAVLLSLVLSPAAVAQQQSQAQNGNSKSVDILRQDVLRFIGPMADRNVNLPADSFLVRLNPKSVANASYGMLIRGVDSAEQALLEDAKDGKWDNFDLFQAALVAEGVRDLNQIQTYENKLHSVLNAAFAKARQQGQEGNPVVLTQEIFENLHQELLTKPYDIDCTNLSQVLESGHFNCVSATVLFNALAEKAGLEVCALEMPGHALSRVKFNGRSMNLETTAPNWFALQSEVEKKEATLYRVARPIPAAALPTTGNPQVENLTESAPSVNVADVDSMTKKLREISPVQLVATIYYNQGVDFLAKKQYAEAAMANVKALHLDPSSETAWGNLLATINNWAIEMSTESKRYDLAATLLDQGVYLDSNYDKFRANQLHTYYNWIRDLALEGRAADAQTVFAYADQRLPNDADLANLMQAILKR